MLIQYDCLLRNTKPLVSWMGGPGFLSFVGLYSHYRVEICQRLRTRYGHLRLPRSGFKNRVCWARKVAACVDKEAFLIMGDDIVTWYPHHIAKNLVECAAQWVMFGTVVIPMIHTPGINTLRPVVIWVGLHTEPPSDVVRARRGYKAQSINTLTKANGIAAKIVVNTIQSSLLFSWYCTAYKSLL